MAAFVQKLILDTSEFTAGVKKASAQAKGLADETTVVVNADTSSAIAGIKKVDQAVDGLPSGVDINVDAKGIKDAAKQADGLADALTEASASGKGLGGIFDKLKLPDFGGVKEQLGGVASGLGSGGIGGALAAFPIPQVAAIGAAVVGVGAAFAGAVEKGAAFNKSLREASLSTGLAGEELDKLGEAAQRAFVKGVGENGAEAIKTLASIKQTLGENIPTDALDSAAVRAQQLAQSLGVETPELVGKISPLIKQYGLTFDEALNQVAAGAQKGVADIGGYLDAINEFTVNAKEAGFTSEEFGAALQNASKAGIKDLAKVGDGIKEIENRIKSGDLGAQFATVSGQIGKDLQNIAQLGRDGVLSGKDVLQQSVDSIDAAFQSGQISEAFRGQLLTQLGGSIAEDVGSDVFTNMFSAKNLNTEELKKSAIAAGKTIDANIPPPSLGAVFENIQTQIGRVFDDIYKNIIGPVIVPIVDGIGEIQKAFQEAFGAGGGGDLLKTIGQVLKDVVAVQVANLVNLFKVLFSVGKGVFDAIKAAVSPVIDAFSQLFDGLGEGVGVFDIIKDVGATLANVIGKVLYGAVRVILFPIQKLGEFIAALIKFVVNAKDAIIEWVSNFAPLRDALTAIGEKLIAVSKGISDFVSGVGKALGLVADDAPVAAEGIKDVEKAAGDATDEVKKLAKGVNELAQEFNTQLSAAQNNLANLIAAGAATKGYRSEIAKAAKELRKLEQAQDAAALAGDPARQAAIRETVAAAARATVALEKQLTADLIVERRKREVELLKVTQEAAQADIEAQIKQAQVAVNTGGAGLAEAKANLEALLQQQQNLIVQQGRETLLLTQSFETERLDILVSSEQARRDALSASTDIQIALLQRQIASANLTPDAVRSAIDAQTASIKAATDAQVRAIVESTPEYAKAAEEIRQQLATGILPNAEAAQAELDKLRTSIVASLTDPVTGAKNPLGTQIAAIIKQGEVQAVDAARSIRETVRDTGVSLISSDILRAIEEQVSALEKQRDTLLQNEALTDKQRANIEEGFAKAIAKATTGARQLNDVLLDIADAAQAITVELNTDEAVDGASELAAEIAKVNEELLKGNILYQDALNQIAGLQAEQGDFLNRFGSAFEKNVSVFADSAQANVQANISALKATSSEIRKVQADTTISEEQRAKELSRLYELQAAQQKAAIEGVTVSGSLAFAQLLVAGENVGTALKKVAGSVAQSLVDLYTPTILALFQSIIPPPFGLIAGSLAVAGIKAALSSALAGFKEGGYTGDVGTNQVAGVVHGREFVVNAQGLQRNPDLMPMLEFINAGGKSTEWMARNGDAVSQGMMTVAALGRIERQLARIPDETVMKHAYDVNLSLDDRLYERQRHRTRIRGLR